MATHPDFPAGHLDAIRLIASRLPLAEVNWALTGSASHRLQGVPVTVADVDLQTDGPGTVVAAERLREYVTTWPYVRESERMRSHFGTLAIGDVAVELIGGIQRRATEDSPWTDPVDPADHRVLIEYDGLRIPALSLDYEAWAYDELGRHDRAELLRQAAGGRAERA